MKGDTFYKFLCCSRIRRRHVGRSSGLLAKENNDFAHAENSMTHDDELAMVA